MTCTLVIQKFTKENLFKLSVIYIFHKDFVKDSDFYDF